MLLEKYKPIKVLSEEEFKKEYRRVALKESAEAVGITLGGIAIGEIILNISPAVDNIVIGGLTKSSFTLMGVAVPNWWLGVIGISSFGLSYSYLLRSMRGVKK